MEPKDIIDFWFHEIEPRQRFVKDEDFDKTIIEKFKVVHFAAQRGELFGWRSTAEGRLAEVIVLDQFSRNMFRDTAEAFAFDALALVLSQEAIFREEDQALEVTMRSFLYMPFMHSESLIIHDQAMKLFAQTGMEGSFDYEKKHKAIIDQFGRYPHRNKILGRISSPEEVEFLARPGSSF